MKDILRKLLGKSSPQEHALQAPVLNIKILTLKELKVDQIQKDGKMGLTFWLTFALNTASSALQAYLMEADPALVPVVQQLISDIQNLLAIIHKPKSPPATGAK